VQNPAQSLPGPERPKVGPGGRADRPIISAGSCLAPELVELEGGDHRYWLGNPDASLDQIGHFATGTRAQSKAERVLATVLFTDIAGSTSRAAELGDERWSALLERHRHLVRRQLERFRSREVKTMGDGFLATFDGPARAIACRCAIRDAISQLGLGVRAGLHTGEIEVADSDVARIAVHIGRGFRLWPNPAKCSSRSAPSIWSSAQAATARNSERCCLGAAGVF
jgi:hypothetical protein